jgi:pimeloyl-ACP methyl ester carboxylesterase
MTNAALQDTAVHDPAVRDTSQYSGPRRTRAACALEFLALAGSAALVTLAVIGGALYWLVDTTTLWWGFVVVLFAGAAALMAWLGILEFWSGRPWRELADEIRPGQPETVRTADGVPLHVEIDGPADAAVTVVFVHGIQMNASAWRYQRPALEDSPVRRVSYDARGHGKSGTRKLDQGIRGLRQLADDLGRVIDATAPDGYLVLAGHGMGGATVLALRAARPDLADRIGGLVLCSTSAGPLSKTMSFGLWRVLAPVSWLIRREVAGFMVVADAVPRFVLRLLGLAPYLLGLRFFAVHKRTALRLTTAIVYGNGFRQAGDIVVAIQDHDERAGLAELGSAYTAVVGGFNDHFVPIAEQQKLADAIPGATMTIIPQCGHQTVFENPEVVNAELRRIIDLVTADAERLLADAAEAEPETRAGIATLSAERLSPERVSSAAKAQLSALGAAPAAVFAPVSVGARTAADTARSTARSATHSAAHSAQTGSATIKEALTGLVDTVEHMAPEGPVRSGLHLLHKALGGDDADDDATPPRRGPTQ